MDISIIVNICLSVSSFLLAFISVVILIVTIRQNHLILENESRAYLSIYGDITNCQAIAFYLIIKNFGKSSAQITSLECDTDLRPFSYVEKLIPFSHMAGTSIAPNQSFKCALQQIPLFTSGIHFINFKISYESNRKKYSETFCVNLQSFTNSIQTNDNPSEGSELKTISYALQDINRRLL
ncbi:MAG: hypothetical protein HFH50_12940 [Lachnospiraceae bacterium]|jgi:hypothetical protein|nr:hypothetical protein [Lachnospiraceae bacterium]GFI28869.1 hypothetical protein IMSAGC013_00251 [Lachnospiraceae bacterium]